MFAEEEWTDSPSADGSPHIFKVSPAPKKDKVVGKKSLLRTLQTLGSVPNWEIEKTLEDSDEEKDTSLAVQSTKKKRCKKRKRKSNADDEGKQQDEVDTPETPTKKKKPMKKTGKGTSSKVSQESRKDKDDKGAGPQSEENESRAEAKLSRKQWKNKMKNKKRSKNKYLTKTTGVDDVNAKKEPLVPTQDIAEPKKRKKQKSKKMAREKNGISSTTDNVENGIDLKTDETSRIVDHSLGNNVSHEVKEKPSKITKKTQLQAEKLRRILKSHLTDDSNKAEEEPKDTRVNLKADEEQVAPDRSTALRTKMVKQLEAARFRYINELLYTSSSGEAKRMFQQDPEAITVYHKGYTTQVQHWPINPVDPIISYISKK